MTLSKQLSALISILFLSIFLVTFYISVQNIRAYLIIQLESHAQDTASSLGLALSPVIKNNDFATVQSMVNAIYDRGYYQDITITSIDNKKLYERSQTLQVENVPVWFMHLISLSVPKAEALIMNGWNQAGTVSVHSHPGYAYHELWQQVVDTFWWLLGIALFCLLIGILALKLLLKPLQLISQQAEAICKNEFPIQEKLPWTIELRQVVTAMNKMVAKLKRVFAEQAAITEKLREEVYQDPVTSLGNRRYFDLHLQHVIQTTDESSQGALLLIEFAKLKEFNTTHGYQAGDALLVGIGEILSEYCSSIQEYFLARISGSDFGMILPHILINEAEEFSDRLIYALSQLQISELPEANDFINIGIAQIHSGQTVSGLLAEADLALRTAQAQGVNTWHRNTKEIAFSIAISGEQSWQKLLKHTLEHKNIILHAQPVVNSQTSEILHHEILLRIQDTAGQLLNAGLFMPMAIRLNLASDFDKLVVSKTIEKLHMHPDKKFAVNLSVNSITDAQFTDWLFSELKQSDTIAGKLFIEFPHQVATSHLVNLEAFTQQMKELGFLCGVDRLGHDFSSFSYLNSLKLAYLKIDGSFIHEIEKNKDNQFFIHAMAQIAHSLDMKIITKAVETEAERKILLSLNIDGLQGYLIGKTEQLL